MKKIEVVEWNIKKGPIKADFSTVIIDPEKCAQWALSVLKSAVDDKNKRVKMEHSYSLQNAKEQLMLLELCGCKVKIFDVKD